jgi:lysophospholipid acyltransferase (LPLAT)-like uncharacterized protein
VAWLAWTGAWLLRALGWTWRYRVTHDGSLRRAREEKRPVIFSLWHGQLLPLLFHHRDERVAVVISEHADGEIIARIAHQLGYQTVRGSTSRGAARALIGMERAIRDGYDLAITPDGPRGPAGTLAPGVMIVAQRTGAPILATAATTTAGWRLKSWDRFLIPKPFSRVRVAYGEPISIDRGNARDAAVDAPRVHEAMVAAERRADG